MTDKPSSVEELLRQVDETCPCRREACRCWHGNNAYPFCRMCDDHHDTYRNLIAAVRAEQPQQQCVNPTVHPQPCQVCGPVERQQQPVGHVANCQCHKAQPGLHPDENRNCWFVHMQVGHCSQPVEGHIDTDPRCKPQPPVVGHVANCRCCGKFEAMGGWDQDPTVCETCCERASAHPFDDPRCKPGLLVLAEARLEALCKCSMYLMAHEYGRRCIDEARAEVERLKR